SAERLGIAHGDVREHLPVQLDPALAKTGHELAVGETLPPGGRVDPNDPKAAEIALARPPVPVSVSLRLHDLLFRGAVARVLLAAIALRALEDRAALLAGVDGALDPGHCFRPLPARSRFTSVASPPLISTGRPSRRFRFAGFLPRLCDVNACRARILP